MTESPTPIRGTPGQATEASSIPPAAFNTVYDDNVAPWDIPAAQPAFVELARSGAISGKILDVGCGTGELALFLAGLGHDISGVDASSTAIARARKKAADRGLTVDFVLGDACDLEALGKLFDTVVDSGFFHVLSDSDRIRFVAGLTRVVRQGGRYHVMCFNEHATVAGPRRVTQDQLRACFAVGWDIESIQAATFDNVEKLPGTDAWLAGLRRTGDVGQ